MTLLALSNIFIVVFGVLAVWLSQSDTEYQRAYSSIFGLLSQPFWFYVSIHTEQWGLVCVCVLYTIGWSKGFYNNWVKGK